MTYSLTAAQKKCYDFIKSEIKTKGIAPSYEEMMTHMGLKSKSGVYRLVTALIKRGKLMRLNGHARALCLPTRAKPASWVISVGLLSVEHVCTRGITGSVPRIVALTEISRIVRELRGTI